MEQGNKKIGKEN